MSSRLKNAGIGLTVAGSLAIGLIGGYEGLRTKAYRDVVGIPTVCFGETRGVKMGDTYTVAECKTMLGDALVDFEAGIRKCLMAPDAIPDKPYVAFLSLAYNIGQKGFCGSTVARLANASTSAADVAARKAKLRAACDAMLAWNKAGGRVIQGLVNRRQDERALCLSGI